MSNPQYYFAKSKLQIVGDVKELGLPWHAEIGKAYHAFQWSVAKDGYFQVATGIYKGNGVWQCEITDQNLTLEFKWADYLVKAK